MNDYSHSLLGLRDCDLSTVKTVILLRNLIKIDLETRSELTDSYGYTACTEVITSDDEPCNLRISEQSLKLSLCRRITLLNLRTACNYGSRIVSLG